MTDYTLTAPEEQYVLGFDPWGERDADYVTLRSAFVSCRQPHTCAICFGPIAKGERVWAKTEAYDGAVKTFRFCAECCWCIARRYDEPEGTGEPYGFDRMYERWEIGRKRAEEAERSESR